MKKIGVLGLVLVLCLAVVGVGYAHWTKTLVIDGTVTTGTFNLEMSQEASADNESTKDVGVQSCELVDLDGDGVMDMVNITIDNAYPSYEAYFLLDIHSLGTIPAHINSLDICADPFLDVRVIGLEQVPGLQLHQCDAVWFEVHIHVLQNCPVTGELLPQGATLGATITIVADQFNYVP
jgi:hypothetical protein